MILWSGPCSVDLDRIHSQVSYQLSGWLRTTWPLMTSSPWLVVVTNSLAVHPTLTTVGAARFQEGGSMQGLIQEQAHPHIFFILLAKASHQCVGNCCRVTLLRLYRRKSEGCGHFWNFPQSPSTPCSTWSRKQFQDRAVAHLGRYK